jgi:hypothetical protein
MELAEAGMAARDKGAHAKLSSEGERATKVTFCLRTIHRCDISHESKGSGFASPASLLAGKRECLSSVEGGHIAMPWSLS